MNKITYKEINFLMNITKNLLDFREENNIALVRFLVIWGLVIGGGRSMA